MPDDFCPLDEHRTKAGDLRIDFDRELAKFRAHEFDTPKSDWNRAFHNWLTRAREYSAPRPAVNGSRATVPCDDTPRIIRSTKDLQ